MFFFVFNEWLNFLDFSFFVMLFTSLIYCSVRFLDSLGCDGGGVDGKRN